MFGALFECVMLKTEPQTYWEVHESFNQFACGRIQKKAF